MSNHTNLLQRVVRRQVRFQTILKERVKNDKVKEEQLAALRIRTIKKPKRNKGK